MSKTVTIIDFKIIWNKIHHTITDEEQKLLDQWLDEDYAHKKFFDSVKQFYLSGTSFDNNEKETIKAWEKVMSKTIIKPKRKIIQWLSYVSVVLFVIFVTVTIYFISSGEKETNFERCIIENPIEPGTRKATLILDNGETYLLADNKEEVLLDGETEIKNTGTTLEYISKEKSKKGEIKFNTLKVPRGGEYFLVLSDGTKIWLNSETTLRYPVNFEKKERRVELEGEAYFEVTKNKESPFLVFSDEQVVKVLGTEFNILASPEKEEVLTTLVKGEVEVFLKESPEIKQKLIPNNQSLFSKQKNTISQKNVDPYKFIAWKEGRFVFEDESLSDIMETLSKWYNVEVIFSSEEARNYRFTGNLQRYDEFSEILKKIEKTNEIKFVIEDHTVFVK